MLARMPARTLYTAGGNVISTTTMDSSIEIPQNVKLELPYHPVILLLGIYPKE
jgi:hypothetical protein